MLEQHQTEADDKMEGGGGGVSLQICSRVSPFTSLHSSISVWLFFASFLCLFLLFWVSSASVIVSISLHLHLHLSLCLHPSLTLILHLFLSISPAVFSLSVRLILLSVNQPCTRCVSSPCLSQPPSLLFIRKDTDKSRRVIDKLKSPAEPD